MPSSPRAAEHRDGPLGKALARVITLASEFYFRKVIDAVLAKRAEMERMVAYHEGRAEWAEAEALTLKHVLGVAEADEEELVALMSDVLSDAEIDALLIPFEYTARAPTMSASERA